MTEIEQQPELIFNERTYQYVRTYVARRLKKTDYWRQRFHDDIVQHIMVCLWRYRHKWQKFAQSVAWGYGNFWAAQKQRYIELDATRGDAPDKAPGRGDLTNLDAIMDVEAIMPKLTKILKEKELRVFLLHNRDGLSYPEIARQIGTSREGARVINETARLKLARFSEELRR